MLGDLYRTLPPEGVKIALVSFLAFLLRLEREGRKTAGTAYAFGGVRTFPLIGLIGYATTILAGDQRLPVMAGVAVVAGFLWLSYWHKLQSSGTAGVTSEISAVTTYLMGALIGFAQPSHIRRAVARGLAAWPSRCSTKKPSDLADNKTQLVSAKHLSSWVGACPGDDESAGVSHSHRSPKGNRQMRRLLNQAANAAVKTKGSIFELAYRRLVPRLGHAQTIGAIAHRLCRLIWKILHQGVRYEERGPAVTQHRMQRRAAKMIRELRSLGYRVELVPTQSGSPA